MTVEEDRWLTTSELCDATQLDKATVYRMAASGLIPFMRVGVKRGAYRFILSEVREALRPAGKVDPWANPRARKRAPRHTAGERAA